MSPREPHRRQHRRVALAGPIPVRMVGGHEGLVHDVSAGGVRLEHAGVVRPGESCLLQVALNDELFAFHGRVVWSRVSGRALSGQARVESGVVFEGIPPAAEPLLAQLVERDRARVLIVEDEPPVRELLTAALTQAGHEVHAAADGAEGLAKAEQLMPDAILLDVRLPGLDGFEVCRTLKAHPTTRRIPVIFVTAVDDPGLHARATAAGGTACLTKPFRLETLLGLTQTVIENAGR